MKELQKINTGIKSISLALLFIGIISCTKNPGTIESTDERYFGTIENENSDNFPLAKLELTRLFGSIFNNDTDTLFLETNQDGKYDVLLPASDKPYYKIRSLDANVELFTEGAHGYTHLDRIIYDFIEKENELNFRFCKKNELKIEIKKTSNSYKELEIFLFHRYEDAILNNNSVYDFVEVFNKDTVLIRDICRINNFDFSYKIKDEINTLSHESLNYQIDQNSPLLVTIEY